MLGALKQAMEKALFRYGYQIQRLPRSVSFHYAPVTPLATYSPWCDDPEFARVFRAISPNTLVDLYRCWELWSLLAQTAPLNGGILEVGVWRGGTGALLCRKAQLVAYPTRCTCATPSRGS